MLKQETHMLFWQWKGVNTWVILYLLSTWFYSCIPGMPWTYTLAWQSQHQLPKETVNCILLHHWRVSEASPAQPLRLAIAMLAPEASANTRSSAALHGSILCMAPQAPPPHYHLLRGKIIAVSGADASCRTRTDSPGWGGILPETLQGGTLNISH